MTLKRFLEMFSWEGSGLDDNDIKLGFVLLFWCCDELQSRDIGTTADVHMEPKQGCHNDSNQPCEYDIHNNDPFSAIRHELTFAVLDKHPNTGHHSQDLKNHKYDEKSDEILVISDSNAIVQVFAVMIEVLCTTIAGHTVMWWTLYGCVANRTAS